MKSNPERALETKDCPICAQALPVSEFGICRARKDGRNLYCKSCIRKKVTESRQVLREYKSARKRYVSQQSLETQGGDSSSQNLSRMLSKLSPIERVREAIKKNARTQKEIAQETKTNLFWNMFHLSSFLTVDSNLEKASQKNWR